MKSHIFLFSLILLSMKISSINKTAAFKSGGHTVIIVRLSLPCLEDTEEAFAARINGFYLELCRRYISAGEALARARGSELWRQYRRPLVLSVSASLTEEPPPSKKRKKQGKPVHGYRFLRTERLLGSGKEPIKRSETDCFLSDSGLIYS